MATMSISGVVSGMDWDSMIDEIITNAAKPAQVKVNKKKNLTNKKSLFEEMKVTMNSLQSSLTPLKLPSTYKAKQVDIERIDTSGSYKGVLTATVNADAEVNVYDLKVNKLARAQTNRSKQITDSSVSSALSGQGLQKGTMYINMMGQKVGIEINSSDSLQAIKSKINNTVKTLDIPLAVTASVVDNRLIIRSDETGVGANSMTETLTFDYNNKNALTAFSVADSDLKNENFVIRNSKGAKLTYGKDYDVVNGTEIRWNPYEETDNVKLGNSVKATYTAANGDTYETSGTYGKSEAKVSGFTIKDKGVMSEHLTIVELDSKGAATGTEYEYGKDFTLDDTGKVKWLELPETNEPNSYTVSYSKTDTKTSTASGTRAAANDDINIDDVISKYKSANNDNEIPTITLTDGGGVLRTYLDLAGNSDFTMTDSLGKEYEYGRDYVIRVNDSGDGYSVTWAISGDNNSDGVQDINDASPILTKYAQEKDISTYGMQTAPAAGDTFNFTFTKTTTTTATGSVKKSDSNKSLTTVLKGQTIDPSDYGNITISDGTKTYDYGTDYEIDSDGNISWIEIDPDTLSSVPSHPSAGTDYKLVYKAFGKIEADTTFSDGDDTTDVAIEVDEGYGNIDDEYLSYEQIIKDVRTSDQQTQAEIYSSLGKYFSLTDGTNDYVYGTDYRIVQSSSKDDTSGEHSTVIQWLSEGKKPTDGADLTLTYTGRSDRVDLEVERTYTDAVQSGDSGLPPLYSYFDGGTSTISQGTRTFYEGIDYEIQKGDNGNAFVEWKTGTHAEWYYPNPDEKSNYKINLTTSKGQSLSFSAVRNSLDDLDLREHGFTSVDGSITSVSFESSKKTYTYDLTSTEEDSDGHTEADNMLDELGLRVLDTTNGGFNTFSFNWTAPARTANEDLPSAGEEFKAEYTYNTNTFTLSDDSNGKLLTALELDLNDSAHYMAAQDAEIELDGEKITRSSNDIGETYGNELIKGMTIHLKGTGEVSLDVSHDAEKAVESIQTFVDTYNDLMTWMNTRMVEKQVDKETASTIDSDDFRMRWGLLHGNAILRQTKSTMRSIVSKNYTFSFTQRTSSEEVYGTMARNGLTSDATLRIRINSKFVDVPILPTDTLKDIVDRINDDSKDGPMHDIYYDDEGKKLNTPLVKVSVENDRLVINSTSNDTITLSGTSAMNALNVNYTYKGLYQVGIETTAKDYGKSGELEFNANEFMEALEDNADEVQELMLMFANEFDTWTKSMLTSSSSGNTSGTLTREIENLDNQIKTIDDYLERYQERLDRQEENLRTRYGNAETQFARLSQQANAIASILNQLNGYNNNNSNSSSNS